MSAKIMSEGGEFALTVPADFDYHNTNTVQAAVQAVDQVQRIAGCGTTARLAARLSSGQPSSRSGDVEALHSRGRDGAEGAA